MRASAVLRACALAACATTALGKLLVDFTGGDEPSVLGAIELERYTLGDRIAAGQGGTDVFINNEQDTTLGRPSLHYKRSAHFRRAEMRILDHEIEEGKTYYIGFTLRLAHSRDGLAIFQWKKGDKAAEPKQNIPFHLEFDGHDKLTLGYTTPGKNGSDRHPVWHGDFSTGDSASNIHSVAFAVNTDNNGNGWLEFWLDGVKQTFDNGDDRLRNVFLFTGRTYPKIGIYRGEAALGDESDPADRTFNSFLYRAQISDSSLDEVAEAGGLTGGADPVPTSSDESVPTSTVPVATPSDEPVVTSSEPATPTATDPPPTSTCQLRKARRLRRRQAHAKQRALRRKAAGGL